METYEESLNDVLYQINSAKAKGKKSIKVKTFQCEFADSGRPKNYWCKTGFFEGGEGVKHLRNLGYNVTFTSTDKQITQKMIKDTLVSIPRKLKTTNMVVTF